MATAAIIGGGAVIGGLLAGKGAKEQGKANVKAAEIQAASADKALQASQAQQALQNERSEALFNPALQAQQAQLALLGQSGDAAAQQAAQDLTQSPLVQAINQQSQQNIQAQAAASGVSGGNLLTALQNANTANIMQAGFSGLGQVAGQQQGASLGFAGQAGNALSMANQQQNIMGAAQGQAAAAQGAVNAVPWLTGAGVVNNLTSLGSFAAGGGFGQGAQSAIQNFNPFQAKPALPAPTIGGGGTLQTGGQPVQQPFSLL